MTLTNIFLLAFALVSAKGDLVFEQCAQGDQKCLSKTTEMFLKATYAGDDKYKTKSLDPLIVPPMDIYIDDNKAVVMRFKNTKVTGLKDLVLVDYALGENSLNTNVKGDYNVVSDVEIEIFKANKIFKGSYSASMTAFGKSFGELFIKEINGEQHFTLGPETNTCELVGEPKVVLGDDLQESLDKDEDVQKAKAVWEPKKLEIRKKALCAIVDYASSAVIYNLKALAAVHPIQTFVKV